jgi:phosphate transport system substrate-binding protein
VRGALFLICAAALTAGCTEPSESVRIVGSSTVYPFSRTVAERTAAKFHQRSPIVEMTGTGGGIQQFCRGAGEIDIANASRPIKDSEIALCQANGVEAIGFRIGYDGIVVAAAPSNPVKALTRAHIYRALAKDLPGQGGFEPNPNRLWSDVDPALPAVEIEVHGPPPTSGTRDAFVELALEPGARAIPELAALEESDPAQFKARAGALREDGRWIDEGENDNAIIQLIRSSPTPIGVFGYSYFDQNRGVVAGVAIDGERASIDTIADGRYPLARSLYFYVDARRARPALANYVLEFMSEAALGPAGYLTEKGVVPLPAADLDAERKKALAFHERASALQVEPRP